MILALDVDGVVVTGHRNGGHWNRDVERLFGVSPLTLQEQFFRPHWPAIVTGEKMMMPVLENIWPELRVTASAQDFVDHWFAADSAVDAAVLGFVDEWRSSGRKAILATNQEACRAGFLWGELDLSRHFDAMFYSADLKAQKPDMAFFRRIQERLGVAPDQVIFADDCVENVIAADAHGWRGLHYRSVEDLRALM